MEWKAHMNVNDVLNHGMQYLIFRQTNVDHDFHGQSLGICYGSGSSRQQALAV